MCLFWRSWRSTNERVGGVYVYHFKNDIYEFLIWTIASRGDTKEGVGLRMYVKRKRLLVKLLERNVEYG